MKARELDDYIYNNGLLKRCYSAPGIYVITIDEKYGVYIGQSVDMYQRCSQHIYNIQNAMLNQEKKYLLLLSAQLGGHKIDCHPICYCDMEELDEIEQFYIKKYNPVLNIINFQGKKNNYDDMKIEDLLAHFDKYEEEEEAA